MSVLRTKREPCRKCAGLGYRIVASPASLRKVRQDAGVGLRQLASSVLLSASYLCDVELGRRRATPRIVEIYRRLEVRRDHPHQ